MAESDDLLAGPSRLMLLDGVALLRPDEQVIEAKVVRVECALQHRHPAVRCRARRGCMRQQDKRLALSSIAMQIASMETQRMRGNPGLLQGLLHG